MLWMRIGSVFRCLVHGHAADRRLKMQLLDELEPLVAEGGLIIDWHTCELFPERWPDLVVVLRCDHSLLWERLEKRCVTDLALHLQIFLTAQQRLSTEKDPRK